MRLLLLSLGIGSVPEFLAVVSPRSAGPLRLAYVGDAARPFVEESFVQAEREQLSALGHDLIDTSLGDLSPAGVAAVLDTTDAVYVAGGSTFALLAAMRTSGADKVLVERVRAGLPYIGSSAGSVVAGPSIEPVSLMDDPADAPGLTDRTGLGLVDTVVIPHADGALPPYPPTLIAETVQRYQRSYPLTLLEDDQALLVDGAGSRVVPSA